MKSRLTAKYILTVILVVIVDFLVAVSAVQIATGYFVRSYIEDEVYVRQNSVCDAIDPLVYRTLSAYFSMFTSGNIASFRAASPEDKGGMYAAMYAGAVSGDGIIGGCASFIDDGYYSCGSDKQIVTTANEKYVLGSKNQIDYVTTYVDEDSQFIVLGKRIQDPLEPARTIGATFFYLQHDNIASIIAEIAGAKGYSFILDGGGTVVAHQISDEAGLHLFDVTQYPIEGDEGYKIESVKGEQSLVSAKKLEGLSSHYGFDWHIVSVESYAALFGDLDNLRWAIIGISLAVLALTIALAVGLARRMISPLVTLKEDLAAFNPLNPQKMITRVNENDELYQLEKSYEDMTARISELVAQGKEDSERQRKLELDSLQMQINPHFLYNTLDAIAWMAKIKKEDEIERLVMTLARFFRLSLHKGDKFISVAEEIELVKCFTEIEAIRWPDRFEVTYDISKEAASCEMLKLLVQPIVENAINHGLAPLKRRGHILIKAWVEGDKLLISITDDGVGFVPPPDLLAEGAGKDTSGYGLKNVNDRIRLEYGGDCGLTVFSEPGKGTKIVMKINVRRS
jgi:two-component system sensor histidine kinase YesM